MPALQRLERADERLDGAVELDHLAAQEVDPLGRVDVALGEDLVLDLGDVVVDPGGDRLVVVDDLVEDRPGGGGRADLDQFRAGLEPLSRAGARALPSPCRIAITIAGAEEQVDLAEVDLLAPVVVMGGLEDDEVGAVVVLELRALMLAVGVLERELVKPEGIADPVELVDVGIVEAEPDEPVAALGALGRRLDVELLGVLADAAAVLGAVDDHGLPRFPIRDRPRPSCRRQRSPAYPRIDLSISHSTGALSSV